MRPDDRTIQEDLLHIRVVCKMLMQRLPDLLIAPACKALVNTVPVPLFVGQQAPLGAAAQDPEHAFQETATGRFPSNVHPRASAQEGNDFCPLVFAKSNTVIHPPIFTSVRMISINDLLKCQQNLVHLGANDK